MFESRRALSGAVVALCVVAQLATAAHLVLVRHTFCSVHGEAVDGPRAVRRPLGFVSTTRGAFVTRSHEQSGIRGHSHCAFAVNRSSRIAAPPPPSVHVPLALLSERVSQPARVERTSGAGVLFLAPKTSPPA